MECGIRVSRIGIETLAHDEAGLAVRIAPCADKSNIRRQRHIAGDFLPHKMEGVIGGPHVFASACDAIALETCIVFEGARMPSGTNIRVSVEHSTSDRAVL